METTDIIKDLIAENRLEEAIELLNRRIEQNEKDDEAYYLLGNIFRKKGNWKQSDFLLFKRYGDKPRKSGQTGSRGTCRHPKFHESGF